MYLVTIISCLFIQCSVNKYSSKKSIGTFKFKDVYYASVYTNEENELDNGYNLHTCKVNDANYIFTFNGDSTIHIKEIGPPEIYDCANGITVILGAELYSAESNKPNVIIENAMTFHTKTFKEQYKTIPVNDSLIYLRQVY